DCLTTAGQPHQPLRQTVRQTIAAQHFTNHSKLFHSLLLENCVFDTLGAGALQFEFHFRTIQFKNVSLRRLHRAAFGEPERSSRTDVRRFIYRNGRAEPPCPRFVDALSQQQKSQPYDLLAAVKTFRNLTLLELCATNAGDRIPGGAFGGEKQSQLRTIRFNGNYSRYEIESGSFSMLPHLKAIIFSQMDIQRVRHAAFNLTG